jgi:thiamine-phosphate pyrophosphorylase
MRPDGKIYRIMDANANRAREGLRVVEEYLRLALDNVDFTMRLKGLRHHITEVIASMRIEEQFIMARRSDADVGSGDAVGAEATRADFGHVVTANLRRTQEALRVLEEYSKLVSAEASDEFKRMRFETYTLERDIRLNAGREHTAKGGHDPC